MNHIVESVFALSIAATAGQALAQTQNASSAASGPKTRAEVKAEVRAAMARGELHPAAESYTPGNPPAPRKADGNRIVGPGTNAPQKQ